MELPDMTPTIERVARARVNRALQALGNYHDGLALDKIDAILTKYGFNPMEPAIYCGRDGSAKDRVGRRTWISLTWHKMESGKYEVVTYVS